MCWKCRLIEENYRRNNWDILIRDMKEYSSLDLFFAICEKIWSITVGKLRLGRIFHHKYHKE